MNSKQLETLCLVRSGHRTVRGIAEALRQAPSTIFVRLEKLRRMGLVEEQGSRWAALRLTEAGRQAIRGYFLTYKASGGVELGRMVKSYVSGINPGTPCGRRSRTGTGA